MRPFLISLFVSFGLLIPTDAATESERQNAAADLILKQFHKPNAGRTWTKEDSTDDYFRYECNQVYCSANFDDCWHISIHVHSSAFSSFDRIYAYEHSTSEAFLGAVENMGKWTDYTLVTSESGISRPSCHNFCTLYEFNSSSVNTVILLSQQNKLTLRVNPDSNGQEDGNGQMGEWARWHVTPKNNGAEVLFQSEKTGKYLGFVNDNSIEVAGGGGEWCIFKVHRNGDWTKFENKHWPGKYLAVGPDGAVVGGGGDYCNFKVLRIAG